MRHTCKGQCATLRDGQNARYGTGLRFCRTCGAAYRGRDYCPCCGRFLRTGPRCKTARAAK